jgi:hypothetical protein
MFLGDARAVIHIQLRMSSKGLQVASATSEFEVPEITFHFKAADASSEGLSKYITGFFSINP